MEWQVIVFEIKSFQLVILNNSEHIVMKNIKKINFIYTANGMNPLLNVDESSRFYHSNYYLSAPQFIITRQTGITCLFNAFPQNPLNLFTEK